MLKAIRFISYAVLAPFEPFVRFSLLLIAFLGFLACLIYRLLLHDPRFPLASHAGDVGWPVCRRCGYRRLGPTPKSGVAVAMLSACELLTVCVGSHRS